LGTGYLNCLYAYKRKSASPVLNVLIWRVQDENQSGFELCDFELSHFLNVQLPVTCSVERLGVTFYAMMVLRDQVIRISPLFIQCMPHNLVQATSKCKPANGISRCQTLIVVHHLVWSLHIAHLWQECHNSKFVIFQEKCLKVLKCYNFLWVQRWHNCSPVVSFENCIMTLYLLKVHLQTFLSRPITQKCQILSCDTFVANERYVECTVVPLDHRLEVGVSYTSVHTVVSLCHIEVTSDWDWLVNAEKLVEATRTINMSFQLLPHFIAVHSAHNWW
jgi:hypothetical protein